MRVYLDNCCLNRPFDAQAQERVRLETEAKLFIQAEVREGKLDLCWSYILDFENDANPCPERKESIGIWKRLAVLDVTETPEILRKAIELNGLGIRKKDSLHLASAVAMKCDIFFTTDDGILKKRHLVHEVKIFNPVEFYADPS